MNNNIIFAVLHLKEASQLLKYAIPDVSDTLLLLSKTIIENEQINQSDIDSISSLVNDVRNAENTNKDSNLSNMHDEAPINDK